MGPNQLLSLKNEWVNVTPRTENLYRLPLEMEIWVRLHRADHNI